MGDKQEATWQPMQQSWYCSYDVWGLINLKTNQTHKSCNMTVGIVKIKYLLDEKLLYVQLPSLVCVP